MVEPPDYTKMSLEEVIKHDKANRKQKRENKSHKLGFKSKAITKTEKWGKGGKYKEETSNKLFGSTS
jgi:hypothetical protein